MKKGSDCDFDARVEASLQRLEERKRAEEAAEWLKRYEEGREYDKKAEYCQWTWIKWSLLVAVLTFVTASVASVKEPNSVISAAAIVTCCISGFVCLVTTCMYLKIQW